MSKKKFLNSHLEILQILYELEKFTVSDVARMHDMSLNGIRAVKIEFDKYQSFGKISRKKCRNAYLRAFKQKISQEKPQTPSESVQTEIPEQISINDKIQEHIIALVNDITEVVSKVYSDENIQKLSDLNEQLRLANNEHERLTSLLQNQGKKSNWVSYIKDKIN